MPRASGTVINGTSRNDILDGRTYTGNLTIHGKAGADKIYGGPGSDTLNGGGGNDIIYGSPFDTLIDGGPGFDTLDFSLYVAGTSGDGVNARLFGGELGLWPSQEGAPVSVTGQIAGIENLVGSNYGDALMGNSFVNQINGGAGDDWIIPYGSGDFATGGSGADKFLMSEAGTTTTITDFSYASGDRLVFNVAPTITWIAGTAPNLAGISSPAWIGTYVDEYGNPEEIILLGTTQPTADWIMTVG